MDTVRILKEFHPCIDREKVFRQICCYPDSPVYEEMVEAYMAVKEEALGLCKPKGLMVLGRLPESCLYKDQRQGKDRNPEAVCVLVTIGQEISACSTRAFAEGDYVRGMLVDAMADQILFSLEDDIQRELRKACAVWKRGVKRRMEVPQDIAIEVQAEIMRQTKAEEYLGVKLSGGYMFHPLKTCSQIYLTTEEEGVFRARQDCRNCPDEKCMLRDKGPWKIKVVSGKERMTELSVSGGTLLEAFREQTEGIAAPCGGRGSCGKCRIQVLEGKLPVTVEDEKIFTESELRSGWRLACQAVPGEHLMIRTGWESESGMEVQAGFWAGISCEEENLWVCKHSQENENYGFAIDIGTTTLAVQLISLETGRCLGTCTGLNSQRMYGADVIARVKASCEGRGEELARLIRSDLWDNMERLCERYHIPVQKIVRLVIVGNTVMLHLLLGFPCEGLGKYPFSPYETGTIERAGKEIFPALSASSELLICPGISAFVGADITAGICALRMEEEEEIRMLVDLGTNGELILGNRHRLLAASTAAGPAFEGGNILWGTGSIPGAVCSARLDNGKLAVRTIQEQPPVGICGTGVIELTAELLRAGEMDETGRLRKPWFTDGYPVAVSSGGEQICLTQKDIREIQLAKAAVRAGTESLLEQYGITASQVHKVYVAGGFGCRLAYEKAMEIGMFPAGFAGKLQAAGNSALRGAAEVLCLPERMERAERAAALAKEIVLSSDPVFQDAYVDAMFFGT